jgi:phage-related protein
MKPVRFVGSAKRDVSAFPDAPRNRAGHEIFMLQTGREPSDWKPMPSIGQGACEIRVRDRSGQYRVVYVAVWKKAIYVLHAFQKKSSKTAPLDIELARRRFSDARAAEAED